MNLSGYPLPIWVMKVALLGTQQESWLNTAILELPNPIIGTKRNTALSFHTLELGMMYLVIYLTIPFVRSCFS